MFVDIAIKAVGIQLLYAAIAVGISKFGPLLGKKKKEKKK